jgi:sugar phosphate isomerase/epimerase
VLPENVATDLPKALHVLKKSGLTIFTITTAITSADDPFVESILKTASELGILNYRMGWINYDDTLSMEDNRSAIKNRLVKLSALNKKYGMQAHYQNHAGASFGSPVWDLASILKEINSPGLASQYDIRHATAEAANAWTLGLKLLSPYIESINIKDFHWVKKEGKWQIENTPLGEGMVDFKKYFSLLKTYNITVPICIHYEYDLGGAENGAKVLTIEKEKVLAAMKKDNVTLKSWLKEAGLK